MADYSHIRWTTADTVARYCARGHRPTDEMLLEALELVDPPLVPTREWNAIQRELDPKQERRGRPRADAVNLKALALTIEKHARADVPAEFVKALAHRLTVGLAYREVDRARRWALTKHHRRDEFIRGLYHQFYELLGDAPTLDHPDLGVIDVPLRGSRSEKALEMTAEVMRTRLGEDPPGTRTMLNIVAAGYKIR